MQVYFRGLDVSFFRRVSEVWVSKQRSRPTNTKSAGYKFSQISAGSKRFHFHRAEGCGEWEPVSERVTKRDKTAVQRQKDRERVRDGARDRHRDARRTERQRLRS